MKAQNMSYTRLRVRMGEFKGVTRLTDQGLLALSHSPLAYNFTFRAGALRSDLGFRQGAAKLLTEYSNEYLVPFTTHSLRGVYHYSYHNNLTGLTDDRLVVADAANKVSYIRLFAQSTSWTELSGVTTSGESCCVNYNYDGDDVLIVSSKNASTFVIDGNTATELPNAPHFTSLTKHYERLYGTVNGQKNRVWFSSYLDPTDWTVSSTGAGFIDFNDEGGAVLRVLSFQSYLYIFREHEILRMRAYGDQSDFTLSKLYTAAGRIYGGTVTLCGNRIVFLSDDGLCSLADDSAVQIAKELTPYMKSMQANAVGSYARGKYYLAFACDFGDDRTVMFEQYNSCKNNAVAEYDLDTGTLSLLRGVDVRAFCAIESNSLSVTYALFRADFTNIVGQLTDKGEFLSDVQRGCVLPKHWESGTTDLGYPDRVKVVREVYFDSDTAVDFTLEADGKTRQYNQCVGATKLVTYERGKKLRISFDTSTSDEVNVKNVLLVVDLI